MKALMILGALVGFLIGGSPALAGLSSWPAALWRASAAALVAAMLVRWWSNVFIQGLRDSVRQRNSARRSFSPSPKVPAKS
jgi:hypothetical protein